MIPDSRTTHVRLRGSAGTYGSLIFALRRPQVAFAVLMAATILSCLMFLANAFAMPGSAYVIQDDARQFLAWTARIADPVALRGDLIADYWESVTPRVLRWLYRGFAAVGISPVMLSLLLPPVLLLVSAFAAWRVAMVLTCERALAAFIAAAFTMALLVHEDSIFTSTARAFSPPLFLLFLDGLLRRKGLQIILSLGVLAAIYPTTALVGLTMLGLSWLRLHQWPPFDATPRTVATILIATLAVAAPILTLPGEVSRWEPVITIADALTMPNLATPGGRSSIVPHLGAFPWMCSARVGILPEIFPCWASRWAVVVNVMLLLPLLALGYRAAFQRRVGERQSADIIYFWAVLAGVGWWAIATLFAFKLHLPARYPQRVLSILEWMAIGQIIGVWFDQRLDTGRRKSAAILAALLAIVLAVSFATPTPGLRRPAEPQAIAAIAAAPADVRIGGLSSDLDFVPALTGRSINVSIEHAIPYHLTYFHEIERRLTASVNAVTSPDPEVLARFVSEQRLDLLLVDADFVARGEIPEDYTGVVPGAVAAGLARMAQGPSALQLGAARCAVLRGERQWLIDATCLATSGNAGDIGLGADKADTAV